MITYHATTLPAWKQHDDSSPVAIGAEPVRWSGQSDPPAINARVRVRMNGLGPGTVVGYFSQDGFLGVLVRLDTEPDWYARQSGHAPAHVFGIELA